MVERVLLDQGAPSTCPQSKGGCRNCSDIPLPLYDLLRPWQLVTHVGGLSAWKLAAYFQFTSLCAVRRVANAFASFNNRDRHMKERHAWTGGTYELIMMRLPRLMGVKNS